MSDSVMPPNDSHAGGKKKKKSSKVAPQPQVCDNDVEMVMMMKC